MNKAILIIDDDKDLRRSLKAGLEKENFIVITADSAESAEEILNRIAIDGIILDRMMGGLDGLSFLKKIRATGGEIPVIMLTAMNGADNTIDGLTGGADDYLAKPFNLQELVLRLNNILKKPKMAEPKISAGFQFINGELFIGKKMLMLSETEKSLLQNLTAGRIVQIQPMVAKRLRAKLRLANTKNIDIITVRGKGYKLVNAKP
jgi:DNA-binding response OmpR family regulator